MKKDKHRTAAQPAAKSPAKAADKPTLGRALRSLRTRNDWTLKEMSERSGIPLSTLANVENDRVTLTYDKLLQLSERLKIRMSDLFAEPTETTRQAITARRSIGNIDRAVRVNTRNYDYYYLCAELRGKRMIPIVTRIRAKSVEEFGELVHHSGEEYIFVLEGRVEIHTEFYDSIVLDVGESFYIDTNMGHAYVAAEGCDEATVLAVCSSPEEMQHAKLSPRVKAPRTPSAPKTKARGKKSAA
jgi:transcriptional regulator with XRE-family HTH domain